MTELGQSKNELLSRIAALSPEQRQRFEQQLKQQGLQLPQFAIPRSNSVCLSLAQERLWFLQQIDPDNPAYNIAMAWRFTGSLNLSILKRSLNQIVQRHASLRTGFIEVDGQPQAIITPFLSLPFPLIDLQTLPQSTQAIEVARLTQQHASISFNLAQAPLLRVTLLQLSPTESLLLLTYHHLIADGWSRGILLQELATFYNAFLAGNPSPLPELPIQYSDFAIWQRQRLQDELDAHLTYWQQQLAALTPLELPTDYPRPAEPTFRSASQTVLFPKPLLEAVQALSRQAGVTPFMTLLTVFNVLLHRYSGQDDIAVGVPIANRHIIETEKLVGFFVNTLVLRSDLSGDPSFQALLERVRIMTANAYRHQDLPFAKLVEILQPQRSLSYHPLFQVMFQFQNQAYQMQNSLAPDLKIPGLKLSQDWIDTGFTKFDLTWHGIERVEGLLIVVEYRTDLFKSDTIERMLAHFQVLLEGILHDPTQRLSELPLLTATEQAQLLTDWNHRWSDQNKIRLNQPLHCLFEAQVEQTPDQIAVVFQEQSFTYRELNAKANQLAHYLQTLDVQSETLVGICVERSPLLLIGLLGILKAGAAYVPLDPQLPNERLLFIVKNAQMKVLITDNRTFKDTAFLINCNENWHQIATFPEHNLNVFVTGKNLAYVIYTSGSTGMPKGTLLTHQGLINYLNWCIQAYTTPDGCGAPVQSSVSFDATITSLFTPLLMGQTVTLLPEAEEVEALGNLFDSPFSLIKLTPAHLRLLSQKWLLQDSAIKPSIAAQTIVIGGEALSETDLTFWRTAAPHTRLINEYGPTEATVGCCVYEIPSDSAQPNSIPIGRPIYNTQLYILDQYLHPVPIGVPGELYVSGIGVARGYLNRPDLTAEKFIPNPFLAANNKTRNEKSQSSILYKTGDLARYQLDGTIEYLGRLDHQIKMRGFRIELEEIAAVLTQHPQIQAAVVSAPTDLNGNKRLVAYVVVNQKSDEKDTATHTSTLRQFLKAKLPDYMIPASFIFLESLPLTTNGKVDRKALPQLNFAAELSVPNPEPRTAIEARLAEIWSEVLGVTVGIQDNFFELGGNSLLATRVNSRLRQAFQLDLPLRNLFEKPTIAELAERIETMQITLQQIQAPLTTTGRKEIEL